MKSQLLALLVAISTSGCATLGKSMALGASIGAGTGAVSGQAIGGGDNRVKGAIIGTVVGAAAGTLFGWLAHSDKSKKPHASHTSETEGDIPFLTKPSIRRMWVDDQIEGDKYIKGHYIYFIDEKSKWGK